MHRRLLGLLFAILLVWRADAAEPQPGIELLSRLDRLPVFKQSVRVASQSTYDRTGGNDDGFSGTYSFVRREADGLVLFEAQGPGIIHRIATPTPTSDLVEFYFDGEKLPRLSLPLCDLFTGKHEAFPRPLVGSGAGGFYCYVPVPYAKSCKIVLKSQKMQFYQINYATYLPEAGIASITWPASAEYREHCDRACKLFGAAGQDLTGYTATNPSDVQVHRTQATLQPGKTCELFRSDSPGRIVGLRLGPASAFAGKDRAVVLRAFWDDDPQPAVLVPVGDFFGYAWGQPACRSLLVGTAVNTNYLYFPMPFDRSGRIELVSEQTGGSPVEIQAEIITEPVPRGANEGKFYALWRRENPTHKGRPFTFLETKGRGHLVACFQQSQGYESGTTYFFEGDDQTTIDGELVIHGTGSEDFYNGGWYDVAGRWETRRSFPLSGCLGYIKHMGRSGGYRLLLGDAYAYRESILQTIEHAPTNNDSENDYCGLAFWYSEKRPTCDFTLPAFPDRRVVDLDRLVFTAWWNTPIYAWSFEKCKLERLVEKLPNEEVRLLSLQAAEKDVFGDPFIAFTCEIPVAGRYRVSLVAMQGPEQGTVQLVQDETPVGPEVNFAAAERKLSGEEVLGTLELEEGANHLMFKLTGKPAEAPVRRLDLRNIICERVE